MTKYELLKACRSVCDALTRNGINATDTKYIDMMTDYIRMTGEGQKVTWVVYYLSQQYEVGEATVYRMAKRLSENCEI
jgi:hypothetical protein